MRASSSGFDVESSTQNSDFYKVNDIAWLLRRLDRMNVPGTPLDSKPEASTSIETSNWASVKSKIVLRLVVARYPGLKTRHSIPFSGKETTHWAFKNPGALISAKRETDFHTPSSPLFGLLREPVPLRGLLARLFVFAFLRVERERLGIMPSISGSYRQRFWQCL
jgi:hypothetical protein